MKNKELVLYLSAVLAFGNNSLIASQGSINNGNDQPTNTNKSEDYKKSGDDADKLQSKKDGTFSVEGGEKSQSSIASQNFSINFNLKSLKSSFKKKMNVGKISGDVFSVEGNFMVSFLKNITYKRAFAVTLRDDLNFCDEDKRKEKIASLDTKKLKAAGSAFLSWFLDAERELSIYGYEITQRISPLSVKSDCGYRFKLFSVKNVFNVLNRLSCTSFNPGCMDFLNVSIMRTDAYSEKKQGFCLGLMNLCLDIFSLNKKFSDSLEIGFLIGTHYNLEKANEIKQILFNAALQFSLNCTCKYIFMDLKLIGYLSSNNIMGNDNTPLNIYLDYTDKLEGGVVPVKIKLGSSFFKGKRVAAFGRKSLICKDICLDIKSDILFHKNPAALFSYDLSLNFSLEKYIDIAVGICSHDKGLGMFGEVKSLKKDKAEYGEINSRWFYSPVLYLEIQINWLELRK
jgi:hypothetical protein